MKTATHISTISKFINITAVIIFIGTLIGTLVFNGQQSFGIVTCNMALIASSILIGSKKIIHSIIATKKKMGIFFGFIVIFTGMTPGLIALSHLINLIPEVMFGILFITISFGVMTATWSEPQLMNLKISRADNQYNTLDDGTKLNAEG